jgi:mannose-6-phosphate isomerase-like protein (cupin superfamily)
MKRIIAVAGLILLASSSTRLAPARGLNSTQDKGKTERFSTAQIDATVKKMVSDKQTGLPVIGAATDGYYVMVGHREEKGEAEVHAEMDDIFVAREGHAQVIVGGELVSGRETAAGEMRGPSIKGGQTYDLAPGEVLRIPHGTPHQTLPQGKFTYLVVKVRSR